MFRWIFVFVIILGPFGIGYAQVDQLRSKFNQASDAEKAIILVDIAKVYAPDHTDSCAFYAQKASKMARKNEQDSVLVISEMLLGQIAFDAKEYYKAGQFRKNALDISLRLRDWDLVAQCYYDVAQTWLLRNNYAEAIDKLKKGLTVVRDRNNLVLLRDYYQSLLVAYQKLNNVSAICEYYPLLIEVNRKIDAEASEKRFAELQNNANNTNAANAKDHNDQTIFGQDDHGSPITGIVVIWAILATLLFAGSLIYYRYRIAAITTRDQKILNEVIQETDHIKNDQGSLFRFLTQYAYSGIDSLHKNINNFALEQGASQLPVGSTLNQINTEVFALYGFFQNFLLLLQAQSGQLTPELATVNVPQLATNLLTDYESFAVANDIQLINDVQNNVHALADERLIDIVLRNMISNAFKYVPKNGLITLGAKENYDNVEVWVTDDGIGLTPEQGAKLFELSENLTLPGTQDIKGFGLGLAVCKALIETNHGQIWAETKPGEGFCIRFSLPKSDGTTAKPTKSVKPLKS